MPESAEKLGRKSPAWQSKAFIETKVREELKWLQKYGGGSPRRNKPSGLIFPRY